MQFSLLDCCIITNQSQCVSGCHAQKWQSHHIECNKNKNCAHPIVPTCNVSYLWQFNWATHHRSGTFTITVHTLARANSLVLCLFTRERSCSLCCARCVSCQNVRHVMPWWRRANIHHSTQGNTLDEHLHLYKRVVVCAGDVLLLLLSCSVRQQQQQQHTKNCCCGVGKSLGKQC